MAHFSQHAQFGVGVQGIHCFCLPTPGYWATEKNTVHTLISFSSLFYSGEIRNTFWKHWLPARKGGKQKKKKKGSSPPYNWEHLKHLFCLLSLAWRGGWKKCSASCNRESSKACHFWSPTFVKQFSKTSGESQLIIGEGKWWIRPRLDIVGSLLLANSIVCCCSKRWQEKQKCHHITSGEL